MAPNRDIQSLLAASKWQTAGPKWESKRALGTDPTGRRRPWPSRNGILRFKFQSSSQGSANISGAIAAPCGDDLFVKIVASNGLQRPYAPFRVAAGQRAILADKLRIQVPNITSWSLTA